MTVTPVWGNRYDPSAYQVTGLTAGTTYQFQVRDCDPLTCTPWSAVAEIATAGGDADNVAIYIDDATAPHQIGTGTLKSDGTFAVTATIPDKTPAGQHTIYAVVGGGARVPQGSLPRLAVSTASPTPVASATPTTVVPDPGSLDNLHLPGHFTGVDGSGQQATTTVVVIAAGQRLPALIEVRDRDTQAVLQFIQTTNPYLVHGAGFVKGGKVTIALDSASGPVLATATVDADGTFSAPFKTSADVTSDHTLVATEQINGETIQAKVTIFVAGLPR
jgi:hypothetical protein